MNKELRELIKALEADGFTVRPTKKHYRVEKDGRYVTTLSKTPSDWRARANELRPAARLGFRWRKR